MQEIARKILGSILIVLGIMSLRKADKIRGDNGHLVLPGIIFISVGSVLVLGN